jgi:drug/metabolite transporter (DMT)-like permease
MSNISHKISDETKATIFALTSVLFWSTVASAFKIALSQISYSQLLLLSAGVSWLFYFIYLLITKKLILLKHISFRNYLWFLALGFLNPFLYYLLLFRAYSLLRAQEALSLNYTWVIVVSVLSAIILRHKINLKQVLALLISFIGVIIIAFRGDFSDFQLNQPLGVCLSLVSAFVWALYWLFNSKITIDPVIKLFLNFSFGLIYISIYYLMLQEEFEISHGILLSTIYIGMFEMGLTFIFWLKGLSLTKNTSRLANLIYLSPFISMMLISFILGERILFSSFIGLIFVIFGVILQQLFTMNMDKRL